MSTDAEKERSLVFIDMAYTVAAIQAKKHGEFFATRHCDGYFARIWGVHPLSDIAGGNRTGHIETFEFSPRQVIIEGVAEGRKWPKALLPLNLLVSQVQLGARLVRLIRKNDVSAIAATDPLYSGLFGYCLKKICKKPLCVYVYGNYDELYEATGALAMPRLLRWRFVEKQLARTILSHADLVITANENNLQYAINNGAKAESSAIVNNAKLMQECHLLDPAVRTGTREVFERFGIPAGRQYLLYVGRLLELKHPDDALRAMKVAIDRHPSTIGLMAGDGPMRKELTELAESLGIAKNVIFLGLVDQVALSKLIPSCVTLSPLTGMALIECGLGGSPVVAYDRDWQAEFVKDGSNGFVVGFRDHEAMGAKASEILANNELRARFSKQIRADAVAFTDLKTIYGRERAAYEKMFAQVEHRR